MTKKQAIAIFKVHYMPYLDKTDRHLISYEWGIFTDMLCKNGEITTKQYETWSAL